MNRREWKKSRLSEQQIRKRKILMITFMAAGVIIASAAIIVLLVTGIPGGNGPKFGPLKGDREETVEGTGTATSEAESLSGKGSSVKPEIAKKKAAEEAAAKEAEADEDEAGETAFDREQWLTSHVKVRGIYVTGPVAGSSRFEEILDVIILFEEITAPDVDRLYDRSGVRGFLRRRFMEVHHDRVALFSLFFPVFFIEGKIAEVIHEDVYIIICHASVFICIDISELPFFRLCIKMLLYRLLEKRCIEAVIVIETAARIL